jgi:hypothetical protein
MNVDGCDGESNPGAAAVPRQQKAMSISIKETEIDGPDTGLVEEPEPTCSELEEEIASGDYSNIPLAWGCVEDADTEPECEYCLPPGEEPITRHGLMPAETLPDGRRVHRIVYLCAFEPPGKSIPCRLGRVEAETARYSWTGNYGRTAPAQSI